MRRVALTAVALTCIVALAATSVVSIAPGEMGASAGGWLAPGWRIRLPLARVARIPAAGSVSVEPVEATSSAGAAVRLAVRFRYRLEAAADRALARDASRSSIDEALARALSAPGGSPLPASARARSGTERDPVGAALVSRLGALGVKVDALEWRRLGGSLGPAPVPSADRRKVLLIGLDAADWEIIDPLLKAGRLPNIRRLIAGGARAPLRSYDPMMSPLIWTTMATGVGPADHGIADFLVTDESTGKAIPITSRFRRVKALWNILSDAGMSSGFAGWWASYPADPVRGFLVTDVFSASLGRRDAAPAAGVTWPESYFSEVRPKMILPDRISYEEVARILRVSRAQFEAAREIAVPQTPTPGQKPVAQNPVWQVRKILAATRNFETIGLDLLGRDLDLVGVYFEGIDLMGHRFQHCTAPALDLCESAERAIAERAVENFYEYQDETIGRLVQASPGRAIMVVSDHGFRTGGDRPSDYLPYTTGQPVEWHREYGILILSGSGTRPGSTIPRASVYDVAPTLLAILGLPTASDMPGRVLEEALALAAAPNRRPSRIASYEDVGPPRLLSEATASPEAQAEMVAELQALGYVGPVAAPTPPPEGKPEANVPEGAEGTDKREGARAESARVTYHRNLATFYMKAGRLDEAESELRAANALQPLPKTFSLLSEIRAAKGDIDDAVSLLEEALRTFPEMDQEAILWMIDLEIRAGRPDAAATLFERWRSRITRPALGAVIEGKLALARGDQERAIDLFLSALRQEPALAQAALAAAPLLDARGRLAELEPTIASALATEKRIDEYQNLLALIRLRAKRYGEALAASAEALEIDPLNPRFLETYAAAAVGAGAPQRALDRYRAALEDPRAVGAAWAGYGRLLGQSRRPAEAASAFEKAIALGETNATTYAGLAVSLFESGRPERSREAIREGLRANPNDPSLIALGRRLG